MASEGSLREALQNAIHEWLRENGGGFPMAYVLAFDYVNSDGDNVLLISEMDDQPNFRSVGLAAYLDEWYRDDARMSWAQLWSGED